MRFPTTLAVATASLLHPALCTYSLPEPAAPSLTYLYTAFVVCQPTLYTSQGPSGIRQAIPIVGGNFTGPLLSGTILDIGADWGKTDPQTGIFSADTRYNFRTHDGANIYLQTSGPAQKNGNLHLRAVFETGDKKYYWLNNIVAIAILQSVASTKENFTLRIDTWHMASEYNSTTFINGTTYS